MYLNWPVVSAADVNPYGFVLIWWAEPLAGAPDDPQVGALVPSPLDGTPHVITHLLNPQQALAMPWHALPGLTDGLPC